MHLFISFFVTDFVRKKPAFVHRELEFVQFSEPTLHNPLVGRILEVSTFYKDELPKQNDQEVMPMIKSPCLVQVKPRT